MKGPYYHFTSIECARSIRKNGFSLGNGGMLGSGIYFSDNPVSSYIKCNSKQKTCLIVVNLDLGRVRRTTGSHSNWNFRFAKQNNFDSAEITNLRSGYEVCVYEPRRIQIIDIYVRHHYNLPGWGDLKEHYDFVCEGNSLKTFRIEISAIWRNFMNSNRYYGIIKNGLAYTWWRRDMI